MHGSRKRSERGVFGGTIIWLTAIASLLPMEVKNQKEINWDATLTDGDKEIGHGFIYCIGTIKDDPVKIGFTMRENLRLRVQELQTAYPYELHLLSWIRGSMKDEQKIHAFLDAHRLSGEWFDREPALALMNRLVRLLPPLSCSKPKFVNDLDKICNWVMCLPDSDEFAYNHGGQGVEEFPASIASSLLNDWLIQIKESRPETPLPLFAWLKPRENEDTAIGDLARDCAIDSGFPHVGTLEDYLRYLDHHILPTREGSALTRTIVEAWISCSQDILL